MDISAKIQEIITKYHAKSLANNNIFDIASASAEIQSAIKEFISISYKQNVTMQN